MATEWATHGPVQPPGGHRVTPTDPDDRTPLQRTIQDIRAADRVPTAASRRAQQMRALSAQLDRFVEALEEIHLRGGVRVPDRMIDRLAAYLDTLPVECRHPFPLRTRITYILDDLFEIQELLWNLQLPERRQLTAEDRDLEDDGPSRWSDTRANWGGPTIPQEVAARVMPQEL